jgi:serine protease AprX
MSSATLRRIVAVVALLALAIAPVTAAPSDDARSALHTIPFASGAVDPAVDLRGTDPAGEDLVLVQWERVGDTAAVHAIAATGAVLVQPLAPVSYLVWADAAQAKAIRALDGIRFAGVLPARTRVAPSVDGATTALRVTFVGDDPAVGVDALQVLPRTFTEVGGAVAILSGGLTEAIALSRLPGVYSVADAGEGPALRDEQSSQIIAQGTDGGANAQPGYRDFLADIDADGSGVTIAIQDGGVDSNHPDLMGQVAACFDSQPAPLCLANNNDDAIGHGTHVLGVILGTGTVPLGDSDGFRYGLGVAPGAKAVVQNDISLNSLLTSFPDGYTAAYQIASAAGAIVSNNSWGPGSTPQGYDADTREFDQIVRDANPDVEGDQPLALSWSIMNGSGGVSSQGAPDEAKNIIAVGGSGSRGSRTPDDLCTCTAHGPNLDGRRLVDIVAPGQSVISTRATQGVLCGTPAGGSIVPMPPSPIHGPCTGTSFASPHVTGAYAVFVDWFRGNVGVEGDPSPALVKAAMINTADDLSKRGGRDADGAPLTPIPNEQQGWGRLNLGSLIDAWRDGVVFVDQTEVFTASGESHVVEVEAIDPTQPLKATLVWTDTTGPGQGGAVPGWINDLDLVVTAPDGTTLLGNVFADGVSVPGGAADDRNNTENVFLPAPGEGAFTVTVDAANIIGKASPNVEELTWQDFALVISNARVVE